MKQHCQKSDELQAARIVADKLVLAVKNAAFYPADHAVVREGLAGLHAVLSGFLAEYGPLDLDVHKGHLAYQGERLAQGAELHESIAYMCYRDGIQSLSFTGAPEPSEIASFIAILSSRRLMEDETEGDIVTDLWEAGFSGIRYATNDRLWQNEALLDLSCLKAAGNGVDQSGRPETASSGSGKSGQRRDPVLWQLTAAERDKTRRMVAEEESRYFEQDVFDVFLVILKEQRDREDFVTLLEIIRQCFQRSLSRGEFRTAGRFLSNMRRIRHQYDIAHHWALPHLDDFLLMISGPKVLSGLSEVLPKMPEQDTASLRDLEYLLVRLSPESVLALGQMLVGLRGSVRRVLSRAIGRLSAQDPRPLYQLTRNASPAVARLAVAVLGQMGRKEHLPVILEATRSSKPLVRIAGIEALCRYDPPEYEKLLPLLRDPDERVHNKVFSFLVQRRRPDAEAALRQFLQGEAFDAGHRQPLLLAYRALGACGSERCLDFLHGRLRARPWTIGKVHSLHRQGAAAALAALGHSGASDILEKGAASFWPSIRRACRNALEFPR